ncbi:MAG: ATP-binding protein, partial [Actinomycetota bacterium]|nr:ATP-binding protein [Actinomycetota bacterium]
MGLADAGLVGLRERDSELARLEVAVSSARGGDGSFVFVEGEAGIGKTRLLDAAAEMARGVDFRLLRARGVEVERELAFGVVRQLLEGVVRSADG